MLIMNRGVFKAIVYYDCLDYPLTSEELGIFSFKDDVEAKAESLVEVSKGFHFLKGRHSLVKTREERNRLAQEKWAKTIKAVRWLKMVPYVRLVFASGSLALRNTTENSDLDLLAVVRSGRIWTARFLAVVLLGLLGLRRRRGQKVAPDKICMNHFITDKSLYIPRKSIYTAQLYARLVPIFGEEKLVDDFCEANRWVGEYVKGWSLCIKSKIQNPNDKSISKSKIQNFIKKVGEKVLDAKLGDLIENILRKYQLHRIDSYPLTYKPGGRVKADDESLEFHPDSPELRIIEKYNKKMIELGFRDLTEKSSFDI